MFESHVVFVVTVAAALIILISIRTRQMKLVTETETQISKRTTVARSRPKNGSDAALGLPTCKDGDAPFDTRIDIGFEGPPSAYIDLDATDTFEHCEEYCQNAPSCRGFEASEEMWGKRCRFINKDTLSDAHSTSHPKRTVVDDKSVLYTKTCQKTLGIKDAVSTTECENGWKKLDKTRAVDMNIATLEPNDPDFSIYDEFPRNNFEKCKDACVESPLCGAFQHNWNSSICKLGEPYSSGEYADDILWTSYMKCK